MRDQDEHWYCLIAGTACRVVGLPDGRPKLMPADVTVEGPYTRSQAESRQEMIVELRRHHERIVQDAVRIAVPN